MEFQDFHLAQNEIAKDRTRFRVVCAGRRFGKTVLAVYEMIGKAIADNNRNIAYIAPTYQQARDIAWQFLKKATLPAQKQVNESRLEIILNTVKGGESNVILRGWESVETLRGQRFDFLVIDEIAMMRNFWVNWEEVLRPTLTDTKGEVLFISTPKGFNHFYDLFNKVDSDYKSFHFTSYDNPFLPVEELDKAKKELPEERFAQEYMADFRKMAGLVYKEFDRKSHVVSEIPNIGWVAKLAGQDFGYTNPFCALVIKVDRDGNFWVVEEKYQRNKTNPEIVEIDKALQQAHGINYWYPDVAEPDRIEEMRRAGLNCRDTNKDVVFGVNRVIEFFKSNRIRIHKNCVNLITELETYKYLEDKPDKNKPEEPVKENDHACDALRYALATFTEVPLSKKEYNYRPLNPRAGY